LGTRTPEVVPFPGEHHVGRKIDLAEVRQLAIAGLERLDVLELELLGNVGDPAFAERLPGHHGDRPGAQQRPHRHLDRARIGRRHDADSIAGRHPEDFAREINGALELRLADLRAVRATENCVGEGLQAPAGALGAGAGGEMRHGWAAQRASSS
jgi:hypothetical protein